MPVFYYDPPERFVAGSVGQPGDRTLYLQATSTGRVTSVARSRTLNKTIGLAMLAPALAVPGRDIKIRVDNGDLVPARVTAAPFYDPKNLRQKMGQSP